MDAISGRGTLLLRWADMARRRFALQACQALLHVVKDKRECLVMKFVLLVDRLVGSVAHDGHVVFKPFYLARSVFHRFPLLYYPWSQRVKPLAVVASSTRAGCAGVMSRTADTANPV